MIAPALRVALYDNAAFPTAPARQKNAFAAASTGQGHSSRPILPNHPYPSPVECAAGENATTTNQLIHYMPWA